MRTLYVDPFALATWNERANFVLWVRTPTPFPSGKASIDSHLALEAALAPAIAAKAALLFDVRMSPLRNDPEFDEIGKQYVDPLVSQFERVAVLVATAMGKLQLSRLKRERLLKIEVFDDEHLARAFVGA